MPRRGSLFQTFFVIFLTAIIVALAAHPQISTAVEQLPQPLIGVWAPSKASPTINDTNIAIGQIIRIDLNITDSPELNAFQIGLVHDFSVLKFRSHDLTGTVLGSGWQILPQRSPPELRVTGFCTGCSWPGGSGILIHLDFEVLKKGVTPLALYETAIGQPGLGTIPHGTADGYFTNTAMLGPVVDFTVTPSQLTKGEEAVFDASSAFDPPDPVTVQPGIRFYTWFFGSNDGTEIQVTDLVIKHIFGGELNPRTGTFWVRLIATDNDGNIGLKILKVIVAVPDEHDLRIFRLIVEPSIVQPGQGVSVSIEVDNRGTFQENFTLTLTMGETVLNTWQDTVDVRLLKAFDFQVQTAGLSAGTYEVAAEVTIAPAVGTSLNDDPLVKYADSNNNDAWDLSESVIYDTNRDGQYNEDEPVLAGANPAAGTTLKDDSKVKYVDSNNDDSLNTGEFVIYDSDSDGIYDAGELIIIPKDINPTDNRQTQLFTIRTLQASLIPFLLGGTAVVVAASGGLFIARRLRSRSTAQHQQEL